VGSSSLTARSLAAPVATRALDVPPLARLRALRPLAVHAESALVRPLLLRRVGKARELEPLAAARTTVPLLVSA
jgi:hypothetical protein